MGTKILGVRVEDGGDLLVLDVVDSNGISRKMKLDTNEFDEMIAKYRALRGAAER